MFEGSLEVKLPTYWRMTASQCNQSEERELEEKRPEKKKIQMSEMLEKSQFQQVEK